MFLYNATINTTDITGNTNGVIKAPAEQGDADSRTITGITDKFYTVGNLSTGSTYSYKVKAYYIDGSESPWTKNMTVVLTGNPVLPGDINGDNAIGIDDVNAIINMMLGKAEINLAGDLNGDGEIGIDDVNALINIMLGK